MTVPLWLVSCAGAAVPGLLLLLAVVIRIARVAMAEVARFQSASVAITMVSLPSA